VTEAAAEFARFLRFWADKELRGYCPVYESIARPLADDTALLERVAHVAPRQKIVPVLLFAAVKSLVDREPTSPLGRIYADGEGDPWPPFRDFLEERFDDVAELLRTRRTQTNEVARASATLLALGLAERRLGKPLALIELGPSAGLNLLLDRFSYDYGGGRTAGDPASAVRLACETKGPLVPPIPACVPTIGFRCGIDLDPVDVTDEAQTRWLEACVWPGRRHEPSGCGRRWCWRAASRRCSIAAVRSSCCRPCSTPYRRISAPASCAPGCSPTSRSRSAPRSPASSPLRRDTGRGLRHRRVRGCVAVGAQPPRPDVVGRRPARHAARLCRSGA
jgi:hypothetical protein